MNINVITHHSTSGLKEKQHFKLEKPISKHTSDYLIKEYPHLFNGSDLAALNYLFSLSINHPFVHPSLEMIAAHMGKCKRTAQRAIKKLKELGLVSTYQRWNNTLLYKIADVFKDSNLQSALAQVCPVFKFLLIAWLFCPGVLPGYQPPAQVKTPDVHLENNIYINTPSHSHTNEYVIHTPTVTIPYDNIKNTSKLKTARYRRRLMSHTESGIPVIIQQIRCVPLTKAAQCRLSAYPDEAIAYMVKEFAKPGTKKKENPFGWMNAVCNNYCKVRNIEPDWRYAEQLRLQHKIPDGAPMLLSTKEDMPVGVAVGLGVVVKKETGNKGEGVPTPRQPYVIPVKPEKTREELIYDARNYLFPPKGPGSDSTTPAMKTVGTLLAQEYPDIIIEANRLGPLPIQSPEEIQARIDARLAAKGIKKIDYGPIIQQKPLRSSTKLTQDERYSNLISEDRGGQD